MDTIARGAVRWSVAFWLGTAAMGCAAADGDDADDDEVDSAALPAGQLVRLIQDDADVFGVQNLQGRWYVAKRCMPYGASGSSVTLQRDIAGQDSFMLTGGHVGPGYVFYALAPIHGGGDEAFVDGWETRTVSPGHAIMYPWDGLLSFAYHHVWTPWGAPALTYDGFSGVTIDGGHQPFAGVHDGIAFSVSTTWCYDDIAYDVFSDRPYPQQMGVVSATPGPWTWVTEGAELAWSIDVQLKFATAKTFTVHYEYHFFQSQIDVHTSVKGPGPLGLNYVKEPKFTVVAAKNAGDGFTLARHYDKSGKELFPRADFGHDAQLETEQLTDPLRWRVKLGYGSAAAPEPCTASRKCLAVSATATRSLGGTRMRWFHTNSCAEPPCSGGLDQWAIDVGAASGKAAPFDSGCKQCLGCAPSQCQHPVTGNLAPYAADRDNNSVRWGCRNRAPNDSQNRAWEVAGTNDTSDPVNPGPGVYFHGWEGGSGPDDCEPLARAFTAKAYTNSFTIFLSSQ
jgi:hypothetical protein